ncbi:Smr/MutS family protein [Acidiphilium sp. AL]|uniref:Smr/MutS family protein n=1 Tax=Acidiphilium iwatense TaxID=768198 RepID=A0ABS9DTS1_9PROT|nr:MULTISPECIES: Smr/MutS family protein [Acidiphilium]MCF3946129.1 Smr/MutS family protein [Acidiphilium iwatense]MCU4160999.1 Smr/MutS family protein [Acidiphilium sp. AL]
MARSRKPIPEAEQELWARYLRGVQPLQGMPVPPEIEAAAPSEPKPAAPSQRTARPIPKTPRAAPIAIGTAPSGLDRATWTRFRTGRIAPDRTLDLHGMTAANAHLAVTALIAGAAGQGLRCVEIVTGHGRRSGGEGGVLRREVPLWLNAPGLRAMILAICHPHVANEGALLVLLRRQRP